MKDLLADIMMKSENPDLFEYILYKKLHGTKSTVKKEEGIPLAEPITETVTCPVIDTDESSNTFDVDTTVTPSKVILYHT